MSEFRNMSNEHMILAKHFNYVRKSGEQHLLLVQVVADKKRVCKHVRFSLWDFEQIRLVNVYDFLNFRYLDQFTNERLWRLTYTSLNEIGFEEPKYRQHIACIQSILNQNKLEETGPIEKPTEIPEPRKKEKEVRIHKKVIELDNNERIILTKDVARKLYHLQNIAAIESKPKVINTTEDDYLAHLDAKLEGTG